MAQSDQLSKVMSFTMYNVTSKHVNYFYDAIFPYFAIVACIAFVLILASSFEGGGLQCLSFHVFFSGYITQLVISSKFTFFATVVIYCNAQLGASLLLTFLRHSLFEASLLVVVNYYNLLAFKFW